MSNARILVADDSNVMRTIICGTLKELGFTNFYEAENGELALDILANTTIDMVITDWHMPKLNGLELVTSIRNNQRISQIPILMVTTRGMKDDVLEAAHAGVNDYIVKPFTPDVLEEKIKKLLNEVF